MSVQIIQLGKHKFICGLFWQSLSRPRDLDKESRERARKVDADLLVLRKDHAIAQAGYAHTKDGARRGMLSLAVVVSKTLSIEGVNYDGQLQPVHNWLAAFKLPDGRWAYFAMRDANFLPNGDFAGTKEEVLERLHGDYGLGGWNAVIGSHELKDYGFHNFSTRRIEDLIPSKKDGTIKLHRWWKLVQVERQTPWKLIAGLSALIVLGSSIGVLYWKQHLKERARAEAIETAHQNPAVKLMPHPWRNKSLPQTVIKACSEHPMHLAPGGWTLHEYVCTANLATYSWSRGDSTINYLLEQIPDAVPDLGGDNASYSEPVQTTSGSDENLIFAKTLFTPLISQLQLIGLSIKITNNTSTTQDPSQPEVAPKWQTFSFTLNTEGVPPAELGEILSQPGIRLEKLIYRDGAWSMEGMIYAK